MNKDTQSWSNSNLTEMEELLQKVQQLERENAMLNANFARYISATQDTEKENKRLASMVRELQDGYVALRSLLRNKLAALENQTQWECSCGGTDCEGQKENAALREDKEILDWMEKNVWAINFKYKPDNFILDVREIMRGAMNNEAKPNA